MLGGFFGYCRWVPQDISIENDHNVYVLGAGFSRSAGLPLMSDFLHRMRDARPWLDQHDRKTEAGHIADVLRFRLRAAAAAHRVPINLENIEHLFSLGIATPDAGLDAALPSAICATLDYAQRQHEPIRVNATYDDTYPGQLPTGWTENKSTGTKPPAMALNMPAYDWMVGLMCGYFGASGRASIISFNYDLVVEESLFRLGMPVDYGFPQDTANYDRSWPSIQPTTGTSVALLKLHGSMNWGRQATPGGKLKVFGSYEDLRLADATPVILPPTWRKVFDDQLAHVWKGAVNAIERATRLVLIGFSVPATDLHFRYLLAAGLMSNVSLRSVVVVDPRAGEDDMLARLGELLRPDVSTTVRAVTAGKYLCELGPRFDLGRSPTAPWSRGPSAPDGL